VSNGAYKKWRHERVEQARRKLDKAAEKVPGNDLVSKLKALTRR